MSVLRMLARCWPLDFSKSCPSMFGKGGVRSSRKAAASPSETAVGGAACVN
jgi:hypothetical protein